MDMGMNEKAKGTRIGITEIRLLENDWLQIPIH